MRIGIGTGTGLLDPGPFGDVIDAVEELGFDSIWLPEVLTTPGVDPIVGLAWAAAYSPTVKLGTTMLVTGQNVVALAKRLASLDRLAAGRLLLTLVPGLGLPAERAALEATPGARAAAIEETVPLLRKLWSGTPVTHHGSVANFDEVTLTLRPVQDPLELWLGGTAPDALTRCGRLGDGWLPARCSPETAAAGRAIVEQAATEAGRSISPEHFGVSLAYATAELDDGMLAALVRRRGDEDPRTLVPIGYEQLRSTLERFIEVGFSKFVLRPIGIPDPLPVELTRLAAHVADLQT